jgi:hypothetical protein
LSQNIVEKTTEENLPTEFDDIHIPENFPKVSIKSPIGGSYLKNQDIPVEVETESRFPVVKIEYLINNIFLESRLIPNFTFSFVPEDLGIEEEIVLKVVVYDEASNKGEAEVKIMVNHNPEDSEEDQEG